MTEHQSIDQTSSREDQSDLNPGPHYVCPDCKSALENLKCASCGTQFECRDGFPVLLSKNSHLDPGAQLGNTYDEIYSNRSEVWADQGRTPEFIAYFASLLATLSRGRVLEVGCGEGFLLSAIQSNEKTAIDLSLEALRKTSKRTQGTLSIALAERLPFPTASFDLVVSVGVMEHFIDDRDATSEIFRVLRAGGRYVALIHVGTSVSEQLRQKFREYFYPQLRPAAFLRWLSSKVVNPVVQPIQRAYTEQSARLCLEECGFTISEIISKLRNPNAPLVGPHVLIYIAQK